MDVVSGHTCVPLPGADNSHPWGPCAACADAKPGYPLLTREDTR